MYVGAVPCACPAAEDMHCLDLGDHKGSPLQVNPFAKPRTVTILVCDWDFLRRVVYYTYWSSSLCWVSGNQSVTVARYHPSIYMKGWTSIFFYGWDLLRVQTRLIDWMAYLPSLYPTRNCGLKIISVLMVSLDLFGFYRTFLKNFSCVITVSGLRFPLLVAQARKCAGDFFPIDLITSLFSTNVLFFFLMSLNNSILIIHVTFI